MHKNKGYTMIFTCQIQKGKDDEKYVNSLSLEHIIIIQTNKLKKEKIKEKYQTNDLKTVY